MVFALLDNAAQDDPAGAPLTALITLVVVAALTLRGSALLRMWGPVIGIVVGTAAAAALGMYDVSRIVDAPWVGVPSSAPGLSLDFGIPFWTLLPSFLFLGVIFAIQATGEAIGVQRVSHRESKAVDFRGVQGALAGGGASNLMAGLAGAVPNIVNSSIIAFIRTSGVASRRLGYCIGLIFLAMAFLPKVSAVFSSIPGPVMTGYLLLVTGTLFVDGARTVILNEPNREKVVAAGICFWIGAAFQFGLFALPDVGAVLGGLFKSGITTGGFAAIAMVLYLELTNPRRMRFESKLDIDVLPELNEFIDKFATSRGWGDAMKQRLSQVAEETLLTLAPLDLTAPLVEEDDETSPEEQRRLVVVAASDGPAATWSSSAAQTRRRTSRTAFARSSSTTRRGRSRTKCPFRCCGDSPHRCGTSSTTARTSSPCACCRPTPRSRGASASSPPAPGTRWPWRRSRWPTAPSAAPRGG